MQKLADLRFSITIPLILTLLLGASSCGIKDEDQHSGTESPNLNLTPFEQLVGEWSGIYRAMENSKPFGDASEANFKLNNNGSFSLTLNADSGARAEGEWSEFQGRSMILKLAGSSIPRFGTAGKIVEPTYELQGSSLRISNDLFELKLTRRADGSGGSPGQNPSKDIYGSWSCGDGQGRQSSLGFSIDGAFSLSTAKPGQRLFIAKGQFVGEQGNILRLNPTSSSDPLPAGAYFEFSASSGTGELTLVSTSTDRRTNLGACRR